MTTTARCWNRDGVMLTPEDARQCVAACRQEYSVGRCRWLLEHAVAHARLPEVRDVFAAAMAESR